MLKHWLAVKALVKSSTLENLLTFEIALRNVVNMRIAKSLILGMISVMPWTVSLKNFAKASMLISWTQKLTPLST